MTDLLALLQRACLIAWIEAEGARLLRVGSNAVYRLTAHAPGGPDLFARGERSQGDATRLFQLPRREVRICEHHCCAEIAAQEHRLIADCLDAATRVPGGIRGTAEISQAVAELGRSGVSS